MPSQSSSSRTLAQLISAAASYGKFATDTALQNAVSNVDPEALDSLTEVVEAFQAADSNLNGAITSLASAASSATQAVQSDLDAYKISNDNNVNGVANSLGNSISVLGSDFNTYQQAAGARFDTVESAATALEGRVTVAEGEIVDITTILDTVVPGSESSSSQA